MAERNLDITEIKLIIQRSDTRRLNEEGRETEKKGPKVIEPDKW